MIFYYYFYERYK